MSEKNVVCLAVGIFIVFVSVWCVTIYLSIVRKSCGSVHLFCFGGFTCVYDLQMVLKIWFAFILNVLVWCNQSCVVMCCSHWTYNFFQSEGLWQKKIYFFFHTAFLYAKIMCNRTLRKSEDSIPHQIRWWYAYGQWYFWYVNKCKYWAV